jgi:hypothetical protein
VYLPGWVRGAHSPIEAGSPQITLFDMRLNSPLHFFYFKRSLEISGFVTYSVFRFST